MEKVAQLSQNPQAIKNREQVLVLLKEQQAALRATMHVQAPIGPIPAHVAIPTQGTLDLSMEEMIHDRKRKRMMEDLEFERKQLEVQRMKQEVEQMHHDTHEKRIKNFNTCMGLLDIVRPNWKQSDPRMRLQTEDGIKNLMNPPAMLAITAGPCVPTITDGTPNIKPSASLSVSQIAHEMGKTLSRGDAIKVGKIVKRKYKNLYNADPPKHPQWVDGAERPVNSYTEKDRQLVLDAMKENGNL
jgi:hypothetical protein